MSGIYLGFDFTGTKPLECFDIKEGMQSIIEQFEDWEISDSLDHLVIQHCPHCKSTEVVMECRQHWSSMAQEWHDYHQKEDFALCIDCDATMTREDVLFISPFKRITLTNCNLTN